MRKPSYKTVTLPTASESLGLPEIQQSPASLTTGPLEGSGWGLWRCTVVTPVLLSQGRGAMRGVIQEGADEGEGSALLSRCD